MKPLTAPIFDVQRFSIHDGPGIRTLVFFKGCNLHCAWCQNPESQQVAPLLSFYEARCEKCFACEKACTHDAILKDGYRVDHERCTLCLGCVDACPHGALQPIGDYLSPENLVEQILADRRYYKRSGGGVTFSGGEPTLYPEFMEKVLDLCHEHDIHTTLETCGTFSYNRWQAILPKLQLIYFDLKVMDTARHKQATGLGNVRILENARRLVAEGYPVEFRLALVPGYTDGVENTKAVINLLKELGKCEIHLLGYHNMGETKIDIINGSQKKLGLASYSTDQMRQVSAWFERCGITAHFDG